MEQIKDNTFRVSHFAVNHVATDEAVMLVAAIAAANECSA